MAQVDPATTVENQQVEDPPSLKFTWTIENFSRLNTKKHYSEVFVVGGYKWYLNVSFLLNPIYAFATCFELRVVIHVGLL